jgi:hypothetical protein
MYLLCDILGDGILGDAMPLAGSLTGSGGVREWMGIGGVKGCTVALLRGDRWALTTRGEVGGSGVTEIGAGCDGSGSDGVGHKDPEEEDTMTGFGFGGSMRTLPGAVSRVVASRTARSPVASCWAGHCTDLKAAWLRRPGEVITRAEA